MNDMNVLARLLEALRPWLDHLVIVGGWCHRLHRFHPFALPPSYLPLMTRDADFAFSEDSLRSGDIREALRRADFREHLSTDHRPPVAKYRLGGEDEGFYAEFLAPLRGSGRRRDGTVDATMARAGITAQKLRHLEVLLNHTWTVALGKPVGVPLERVLEVRIANPVSFMAQKLLIQGKRFGLKRAQDALYIHDTVELFGERLDDLRSLWRESVRTSMIGSTARRVETLAAAHAAEVTDVLREAARLPQDRAVRAERIQQVSAYGLERIFGR